MQEIIARTLMYAALLGWLVLALMYLMLEPPSTLVRPASDGKDPGTNAVLGTGLLPKPLLFLHGWIHVAVWLMWLVPAVTFVGSILPRGVQAIDVHGLLILATFQFVGTFAVFSVARRSAARLSFSQHVWLVMAMIGGGLGIQMSMLVPSVRSGDAQAGIGIFLSIFYAPGIAAWCGLLAWGGAAILTRYLARRNGTARP